MPLPLAALLKKPAHIAANIFAAQPQVKLAHRLPPAPVVCVELPAGAQTDTRLAFPWSATNAAHMAAIAAEPQQQVAVGFKGNSARGWQDANFAPTLARRPKHATCLYPLREPWITKAAPCCQGTPMDIDPEASLDAYVNERPWEGEGNDTAPCPPPNRGR